MKNKNIAQRVISEYNIIAENPSDGVWEKIENGIKYETHKKHTRKIIIKPILISVICIILITTVAATAPLMLRMLGSDIAFFESDRQTRYSADQEFIKQHSSAVGVSIENNGFKLTIDNIAFDGIFMNIFYTMKSNKVNLAEEAEREANAHRLPPTTAALWNNRIDAVVNGQSRRLQDINAFVKSDAYFVSDYEMRGVTRIIITDDLPDIFDIEIYPASRQELWHMTNLFDWLVPMKINLTIDMSESKIETLMVTPNVSAVVTQTDILEFGNEISTVEHHITVDRVSISPLGNVLVLTQNLEVMPENQRLFSNYFIVDDQGNSYGQLSNHARQSNYRELFGTFMVEFFGNVPSDVQYLKLIPYNFPQAIVEFVDFIPTHPNIIELSDLPHKFKQSEHGSMIVESVDVANESITMVYRFEGLARTDYSSIFPRCYDADGETVSRGWGVSPPVYDRGTDSYALIITFNNIEDAKDLITSVGFYEWDIEPLEDQAIIIPLR
jgi:hypothetical protein